MFGGSSELPTTVEGAVIKSHRWAQFSQHSRKLGGAAEHLIDGSEKCICLLTFEFMSPHVIERRSKWSALQNKRLAVKNGFSGPKSFRETGPSSELNS